MPGDLLRLKIRSAYRLLRDQGPGAFSKTLYSRTKLATSILARGRNRVVSIDDCRFKLRDLPNTQMKLELLTGNYELPERNAVRRYIRPDIPVIELGACIGVVSCVTNRRLQNPKAHVVLEANPLVIPHLQSNRDINQCSFKIVNRALAYGAESVTFSPELDFWGNSIERNGGRSSVTVKTTQLGQIAKDERFEKFALICDIEGQEYELVMQEPAALDNAELIILEVHPHVIGETKVEAVMSRLADLGFKTIDKSALVVVLAKS
jgi:FkbM family methyltransferase